MSGTATATPTQRFQAGLPRSDRAEECLAGSDPRLIPAASPISPHDDAVARLGSAVGGGACGAGPPAAPVRGRI